NPSEFDGVAPGECMDRKSIFIAAAGAVISALILAHVHGVNGSWFWVWIWRRLPAWPLFGWMALAAAPFLAAQVVWARGWRWGALALLMASVAALQVLGTAAQERPLN